LARLLVLHPDVRTRARLCEALADVHRCAVAASWEELGSLLRAGQGDGAIVDADHPGRREAINRIESLRQEHPLLALVAFADVHGADPVLAHLGAVGVDGVLLSWRPPWASAIRRSVEEALAISRARFVVSVLERALPAAAVEAVGWAVEHGGRSPAVDEMAAALGHTPRQMAVLLRDAGLPGGGRLFLWGRLLQAGALIAVDGRTVEDAALRLGYATASGLSGAMRREVGYPPGSVARQGGLPFVITRLFPGASLT